MTKTIEELKSSLDETFSDRITRQKSEQRKKMDKLKEEMRSLTEINDLFDFETGLTTLVRHIESYNFTDDLLSAEIRNKSLVLKWIDEYTQES